MNLIDIQRTTISVRLGQSSFDSTSCRSVRFPSRTNGKYQTKRILHVSRAKTSMNEFLTISFLFLVFFRTARENHNCAIYYQCHMFVPERGLQPHKLVHTNSIRLVKIKGRLHTVSLSQCSTSISRKGLSCIEMLVKGQRNYFLVCVYDKTTNYSFTVCFSSICCVSTAKTVPTPRLSYIFQSFQKSSFR